MVTVDFRTVVATIEEMVWTCEEDSLQGLLTAMLPFYGPSGSDPDPDHTAAMDAATKLGGTIIQRDEVEYVEGRVY
jgi:hypothetical protein